MTFVTQHEWKHDIRAFILEVFVESIYFTRFDTDPWSNIIWKWGFTVLSTDWLPVLGSQVLPLSGTVARSQVNKQGPVHHPSIQRNFLEPAVTMRRKILLPMSGAFEHFRNYKIVSKELIDRWMRQDPSRTSKSWSRCFHKVCLSQTGSVALTFILQFWTMQSLRKDW